MVFAVLLCSHNLFLGLAAAVFTYILIRAIYNLFFSPLSAIPGPWYAAVSNLWLNIHVIRLRQCKTIQELFEAYGPVVRVGPNKIVFRDISTMRTVYSLHKFDKSTYYKSLLTNDNDHAMTTLNHAHHIIRRRGYAPHYTPANVAKFQPEMHESMCEVLNVLDNIAGKASTECLTLFRHLMVDVVVSSSYGYRLGAVTKWAMDVEDPLSTAINDFPKRGILRSIVLAWAWKLVCRFPNVRWRRMCDSDKIMAEFVSSRVYEMRAQMNAGKIGESEKIPMLQRLLQYRYSSNELMPDHDIISECMGHLIAGSDTSSTSLSYFFWELSRRPDILKKLQIEIDEVMPDSRAIPDISVLQELPYLNAFIKEGLRVYTAAPSLLERVVPNSTAKNGARDEIFDLMGYALPPGTVVSTQAWSMHRDSSVFPSPDTFLPERWLECSQAELANMTQHMMPFGTGTRVCGGQNLAQVMLRIAIATITKNFNIAAPAETNERSMEIRDSFVIFPAAMECKLIFLPRQ
ncbi:cytochrome P450 [Macrolepiota fuliginosa MF-IS2]|uniref:Cytochrome P450 n=1 Tax=Macrolepiota fuliginosa MF-IS2 TaxID=1400762 RepID=A0A9P5X5N9_9AGAR|nr:cytochrome P450 [Macrolepiota fuliginosa MF-IS2]